MHVANIPSIRDRVLARADLNEARAQRDLDTMTAALNAEGLLVRRTTFVTWRIVITDCPSGIAIKRKMKNAAADDDAIETACEFLKQEAGLDVGHAGAWANIERMVVAGILTAAEGQELMNLSLHPLVVDRLEVEAALYNPDNTEKQ